MKKTRILGFVSHDFKNPLSAIQRFAESLKQEGTQFSEKQLERDYILAGTRQLRSMVTHILDRARIDEGHLTPSWSSVNLLFLLDDLMPLIEEISEPQHIQISTVIPDNLPTLRSDPLFLRQILMNVISNAIKYNRTNGKVILRIHETVDRQSIQIQVEDTGIGMTQEQMGHLFQAYYRAEGTIEGTGLGLAFTKHLVEMLSESRSIQQFP
jgi:signal transduction histidine kinase